MVRVHVQMPEEDLKKLQQRAAEEGVSVAELLRRGAKWVLEEKEKPSREELWERAFAVAGTGHSGVHDLGRRHDDYVVEAYADWETNTGG